MVHGINSSAVAALLIIALIATNCYCQQKTGNDEVRQAFVSSVSESPIAHMLKAERLEREGKTDEALQAYRKILDNWSLNTRWGKLASLKTARVALCRMLGY